MSEKKIKKKPNKQTKKQSHSHITVKISSNIYRPAMFNLPRNSVKEISDSKTSVGAIKIFVTRKRLNFFIYTNEYALLSEQNVETYVLIAAGAF